MECVFSGEEEVFVFQPSNRTKPMRNFKADQLKGNFQKVLFHLNLLHTKRNLHDFHVRCRALPPIIRGIIAAVLCWTVSLSAQGISDAHESVDSSLPDGRVLKLNELCRDYLDTGVAGVGVLIVRDGDICFEGHYSRETSKLNEDTIYLIGSNTKQFSALAILISIIGVVGLILITIKQRLKEIAIRKALGAGLFDVSMLLVRQLANQILLASVVVAPLSWFGYKHFFIDNYLYRIELSWWMILLPILLLTSILFAMIQIITFWGFRIKIAPVLQYE